MGQDLGRLAEASSPSQGLTMDSVSSTDLLADAEDAKDSAPWDEVLARLSSYLHQNHSGAQIRLASSEASEQIKNSGSAAWMIAPFGEPAVILIRQGLPQGLPTWHAARLIVALNGSPSEIEPEEVGIIQSREAVTSNADKALNDLAYKTLRSMGVPLLLARRLHNRYRIGIKN